MRSPLVQTLLARLFSTPGCLCWYVLKSSPNRQLALTHLLHAGRLHLYLDRTMRTQTVEEQSISSPDYIHHQRQCAANRGTCSHGRCPRHPCKFSSSGGNSGGLLGTTRRGLPAPTGDGMLLTQAAPRRTGSPYASYPASPPTSPHPSNATLQSLASTDEGTEVEPSHDKSL